MVVKFLFIIVKSGLYTLVSNKKSPEVSVCLRTSGDSFFYRINNPINRLILMLLAYRRVVDVYK